MKYLARHLWCIILVLIISPVHADETEPDAPRQFNIELLIFQNLIENDGGEIWPVDYSTLLEDSAETPTPAPEEPLAVTWLPEEGFHLTAERNALGHSSRYRPLAYLAWRQEVTDRHQARPLVLPTPENPTEVYVDGSVTVAVERYLHLTLDLQLHIPPDTVQNETTEALEIPAIRLTEKRRMRSGEIHYFDNPRFGAITLITPYEPPATLEPPAVSELPTAPLQPEKTGASSPGSSTQ